MKCTNHPRKEASIACVRCEKSFCGDCIVELGGQPWCRDCLTAVVASTGAARAARAAPAHPGWRKFVAALLSRKLAAALLSLVPGAGHMFLGLIGKGFAIMGLLIVAIFLIILYSDATGMYWITAYLIPTLGVLFLSYALFDAMAIADARAGGHEKPREDDDTMKAVWERVLLNRATMGWIILIAGVVGVLRLFSEPFSRWTMALFSVSFPIAGLVIPVVLLVVGILLLKRSRKE